MFKRYLFWLILVLSLTGNGIAIYSGCNLYEPVASEWASLMSNKKWAFRKDNDPPSLSTASLPTSISTTNRKIPFKIAFNTWLGYSPLVWARDKGFLDKEGLSVEIVFLEGIAEKNSALLRGDIDGVGHTADSAVTSNASGVDGQIVYIFDKSFGADGILADKSIETVKDLKGKQVAVEPGFTGQFFLLSLLNEVGLTGHDIKTIPMDTGSAGSAFMAGKVDAAVTWEPWIGKSKQRQNAHILATSADHPGLIIDLLYMRRETIEKRKADVDALILAMGRATQWYLTHKDEGDSIMAKFWKLPLDEVRTTVDGMRFMTLEENRNFFGTRERPGELLMTVKKANNLWFESGITKSLIHDVDGLPYYSGSLMHKSIE
ncbi:MAG: ABC transporter substrate-binding protein [Methylobacter tundripaludum]|nr:ABC transporter substrate-binding protein [Methylobacter tundripaludum]